jgi:hypothetical protein
MAAGELDRMLADMQVLRRYGHDDEVRRRLDELFRRYPNDLLLVRRVVEFHLEADDKKGALEGLFVLASRLFARQSFAAMRDALEQILVLEPGNGRALKLLDLLVQREKELPSSRS